MAHFAEVSNGVVQRVLVVANEALDPDDEETSGIAVLAASGIEGEFVQCSYNRAFRGCYPGPGYRWDGTNFAPPPPSETYPLPIPDVNNSPSV